MKKYYEKHPEKLNEKKEKAPKKEKARSKKAVKSEEVEEKSETESEKESENLFDEETDWIVCLEKSEWVVIPGYSGVRLPTHDVILVLGSFSF